MISITELVIILLCTFALGWFCAITSGALFAYIVFRTKKEQHERLFPSKQKKRGKPVNIDEFSGSFVAEEEEEGLPEIIQKQNQRMAQELKIGSLKREMKENG